MKLKILFLCFLLVNSQFGIAQNNFKAVVQDSINAEKLIGVSVGVKGIAKGGTTNSDGFIQLSSLPNGKQTIIFSFVGYHTKELTIDFNSSTTDNFLVLLLPKIADLEEVVVSSSRTLSRIEDLPMKVEVLGLEEIDEENTIKPGNISSILGDLSIIHIQQTSAVNGNATVRMQGLDGKYTQILRDGLPLYEGYSGSFGILQIPPLDLKQVEIIKGSVSTLYGGGAIAGMINLISKIPTATRDLSFTLNRTTLKENNINGYFSQKFGKFGLTFFSAYTYQTAIDVNGDGFSDSPEINHFLLHPTLFYDFSTKTKLNVGISYLNETRVGGDLLVLDGKPDATHQFFERNKTNRFTVDAQFSHQWTETHKLIFKSTISDFSRTMEQANFGFKGNQAASFIEISGFKKAGKNDVVYGFNYTGEDFKKGLPDSTKIQNYNYNTFGLFLQNGWHISDKWMMELGQRLDFHNQFGNFYLSRIAFFYKPTNNLSFRLSGGSGYKTPNLFTQQTLSGSFKNLLPIDNLVKPEKSDGVNFDINYNFNLGDEVTVQINQAIYYTNIKNPIATTLSNNFIQLSNANYDVNSIGTDTYVRFTFDEVQLYLGYNHTIAKRVGTGTEVYLPFSPQDKFSSTLAYEVEGKWRFGAETSFVANQYINENQPVPNYWFWAGMIEKKFGKLSLVLNCENIFDFRQSNSESLYTGTITNPNFKPLWGPIDGRAVNLAIRIKI